MDFDERESAFRLHQILCSLANEHRRYPVLFPPCEVPWSLDTWDARVRRLYAKCTHDTAPTLYHLVLRRRVDSEIANVVARVSVLLRTAKQITVTREVALTMAFLRAYDADRDHHFRRHHPDARYLCAAYTERGVHLGTVHQHCRRNRWGTPLPARGAVRGSRTPVLA